RVVVGVVLAAALSLPEDAGAGSEAAAGADAAAGAAGASDCAHALTDSAASVPPKQSVMPARRWKRRWRRACDRMLIVLSPAGSMRASRAFFDVWVKLRIGIYKPRGSFSRSAREAFPNPAQK